MDWDASLTEPGPVGNWSKYYHQSCSVLVGMAGHLHPPNSDTGYTQLWEEQGGFLHLGGADSWRPSADCTHSRQLGPRPSVKRDLGSSVAPCLPH